MFKSAPDLVKDPFYLWLNDYHWVPIVVLGMGICVRVLVGLHCTWLVRLSYAHAGKPLIRHAR